MTVLKEQGGLRVAAVNPAAQAAGLGPGLPLSDARALQPDLKVTPAEPAKDIRALAALADWCGRYTPWTAPEAGGDAGESGGGVWLDISGCAHLFGGEADLLEDLIGRMHALGYAARAAAAD
ncbi:MAG: DNA polymerase Y family protein, partial [Proteobacteria bacterium]|nr:DNA polymerase Y family protein [Pseudomonadota bacterium]